MTNKISDEMTANFLYAAILSLRQNVVPALSTPESRIHADLVSRVLYMLQSRFARRGTDIQQLIAEEQSILKGIATLLPDLDTGAKTVTPIDDDFSAIETLERQLYEEEAVLASSIPQLIDMAQGSAVSKPAAINSLRNIVATQKEFFAAQDPDILKGSYVCYQGGRMDEERPVVRSALLGAEVNETTLTQHLQKQFPGARVEKISVMAGGFSKSTIFFTLIKANGESDSLVMRKDLPVDYVSSVVIEFPLLQQVHKAGFPVAEPL